MGDCPAAMPPAYCYGTTIRILRRLFGGSLWELSHGQRQSRSSHVTDTKFEGAGRSREIMANRSSLQAATAQLPCQGTSTDKMTAVSSSIEAPGTCSNNVLHFAPLHAQLPWTSLTSITNSIRPIIRPVCQQGPKAYTTSYDRDYATLQIEPETEMG